MLSLLRVGAEAIGIQPHQIVSGGAAHFELPDFGIDVRIERQKSGDLWVARERYKSITLGNREGTAVEKVVISAGVDDVAMVAQAVVLKAAQQMVELALDGELAGG